MKKIELSQGKFAIVPDEWYEYLNQWKWYARRNHKTDTFYAMRNSSSLADKSIRITILMHRLITNCPDHLEVDHEDHDGLNNDYHNMRLCTTLENAKNHGPRKDNKSGYRGVSWSKVRSKWRAQIGHNKKKYALGYFDCPEEAHKAYCKASAELHGEFGCTE